MGVRPFFALGLRGSVLNQPKGARKTIIGCQIGDMPRGGISSQVVSFSAIQCQNLSLASPATALNDY